MPQKNIPRDEWPDFCKQFSSDHRGWLVTLTDLHAHTNDGADPQARLVARNLALQQITAERDGGHVGVRIVAGDGPRRITHLVLDPAQIHLDRTTYGIDRGLRIRDAQNQSTLVRFNVPRLS